MWYNENMKKINLKYIDEEWELDFIQLIEYSCMAANSNGAISDNQYSWILSTTKALVEEYEKSLPTTPNQNKP